MTIQEMIAASRLRLEAAGLDRETASFDAELLAREALGWDRARLVTSWHEPAPAPESARYREWVSRRAAREPVAYITGHREFWRLDFDILPGVLVPRPETEVIVEEALACLCGGRAADHHLEPPGRGRFSLLADVGTGSGCVAVSLACELVSARIIATDISPRALAVAVRNARRHGVMDRVRFVQADLLAGIGTRQHRGAPRTLFDMIVSNPPYVPAHHLGALQPEVRDHEPAEALAGGADGLSAIRRLVPQAADRLRPGGWLIFELGDGQAEGVEHVIAGQPGLELLRIREDLQGIPRTAVVQKHWESGVRS